MYRSIIVATISAADARRIADLPSRFRTILSYKASMRTQRDDWDSHWTNYADSAERNPAQLYRQQLLLTLLGDLQSEQRVLDVGSGTGDLIALIDQHRPDLALLGVEMSPAAIAIAERKVPRAQFVEADLTAPPDPGVYMQWADVATCSEVLEHVDDPSSFLRNVASFMKPGAELIITVPSGPMSAFDHHIGHRRHFTTQSLGDVIDSGGFEVVKIMRSGFPFFNLYRMTVVMRGQRLIDDVSKDNGHESKSAEVVMAGFRRLFRFNRSDSKRGWQLVAVARNPREAK